MHTCDLESLSAVWEIREGAENVGPENAGRKMQGGKYRTGKCGTKNAGPGKCGTRNTNNEFHICADVTNTSPTYG